MASDQLFITASEVADYVVCPEAWRLKYLERASRATAPRTEIGKQRRKEWAEKHDQSRDFRRYAKIAYLLLVLLVCTVFLLEEKRLLFPSNPPNESVVVEANPVPAPRLNFRPRDLLSVLSTSLDEGKERLFGEICLLLAVLGLLIFMWDLFDRRSKQAVREVGFDEKTELIAVQGSNYLPGKKFHSDELALSGTPDALLREDKALIPIGIFPMASKVMDRHVVHLLVQLKLIEEIEKIRPPHGILLMGAKKKVVRVRNSDEKQRWLDTLLDEMRSIAGGVPAVPAPTFAKCRGCDVRKLCQFSAYQEN